MSDGGEFGLKEDVLVSEELVLILESGGGLGEVS